MVERALVLGGGGPVGVAWEIGVVAGLLAEGVDLARAERTQGTSAGSFVGAHLAGGVPPQMLYAMQVNPGQPPAGPVAAPDAPPPNPGPFLALVATPLEPGETAEARRVKMGDLALGAATISEEAFIEGAGQSLLGRPWPRGFACAAVDAASGQFRIWEAEDGVELARAVASSCAVPGVYPPITIKGRRYIDGGARSATSIDAVAGARRVVSLAVVGNLGRELYLARLAQEAAALGQAAHAQIIPDQAALEAFGPNLLHARDKAAIAQAGYEQGRREAGRVGEVWG